MCPEDIFISAVFYAQSALAKCTHFAQNENYIHIDIDRLTDSTTRNIKNHRHRWKKNYEMPADN